MPSRLAAAVAVLAGPAAVALAGVAAEIIEY